jgi:hypothetical protein
VQIKSFVNIASKRNSKKQHYQYESITSQVENQTIRFVARRAATDFRARIRDYGSSVSRLAEKPASKRGAMACIATLR